MGNVERRRIAAALANSWHSVRSDTISSTGIGAVRKAGDWRILPSGIAGETTLYTATKDLMRKILDFGVCGGPKCTVLRTFRWEVQL